MHMKKPRMGLLLALVFVWASNVQAQEKVETDTSLATATNAVPFNVSSVLGVNLIDAPVETAQPANFVLADPGDPATPAAAAPAAKPKYIF